MACEAELIADAAHRVLGGETLSSIVDDWNRRGVRTTTGGPWRINALSALLIQPRLAGVEPQGAVTDAPVPAIIDRATHERLLALRHARRKSPGRRTASNGGRQYLLTGFLQCWRCGSRLGGITPGTTAAQPHYRCPSRGAGGCSGVVVHAAHADTTACDIVLARIADPEFTGSIEAREAALAREERTMTSLLADAVMGRHPDVGITGLWTNGDQIDGRAWGQLKERLEATARTEKSELAGRALLARQRRLADAGDDLRRRWVEMDIQERRLVIDAVVARFVVLAAPRLRNRFTSERLKPVWRE
ncbi:MAG: recombinase family protein [Actinobacteria bacterium]|nr:recombinase family protein [Actinomycetota bacterium]